MFFRRFRIEPPPLIDEILAQKDNYMNTQVDIGGRWLVAKGLPYYHWTKTIRRLYHAWLVVRGKAMAFQFGEDRYET